MQADLLSHSFSQLLYRVINVIFDCFNQQSVAERIIDVHKITSLLQVNAAPLVSMDHHHK